MSNAGTSTRSRAEGDVHASAEVRLIGERRVIVVGAGPAGVRCAETLVGAGVRPTLIDEGRADGGQIYRRQPEGFERSYAALYGTEARKAEAMHRAFESLRAKIDYLPETLVWNIAAGKLYAMREARQITLPFDGLILCIGATDRLMPVKGWHYAGTFSLGGAQVALKSQACAIGRRVVFLGTGALLYLVAAQYIKAGANVAAVLDTSPSTLRVKALPKLLTAPSILWNGLQLVRAIRATGVSMHTGVDPVEIEGAPQGGVRAVIFRDPHGRVHRLECDAVALGYHLRPETQLADLARCEFHFDARTRQWLPRTDIDGRATVPGIYIAGDGSRILGADAAQTSGRLAALAALQDLRVGQATHVPRAAMDNNPQQGQPAVEPLRREIRRRERFAQGLAEAFPWPAQQAARLTDDTIVCRCECITAGELRKVVRENGAQEANRAKAFSRVGMGRCQGRYCSHAAAEIIAHAANIPIEEAGRLRTQAPVKPLPVGISESSA